MKKRIFSLLIVAALFTSVAFAKTVVYNSAEEFYKEFNELLSDNEYAEIILYDFTGNPDTDCEKSGYFWDNGGLYVLCNGQGIVVYFHSDFSLHYEFEQLNINTIEHAVYMKSMRCFLSDDKKKVIREWNRLIEKM